MIRNKPKDKNMACGTQVIWENMTGHVRVVKSISLSRAFWLEGNMGDTGKFCSRTWSLGNRNDKWTWVT